MTLFPNAEISGGNCSVGPGAVLPVPESSRRSAMPAAKRALKRARFGVAEQESDIKDSEFLIRQKVAGEIAPQLVEHG